MVGLEKQKQMYLIFIPRRIYRFEGLRILKRFY